MSFDAFLTADRRLVVLRVLRRLPGRRANSSVLATGLEQLGHGVARDVVRSDLSWLSEQGLVRVEELREDLHVAILSERGCDVACGRSRVPGVGR